MCSTVDSLVRRGFPGDVIVVRLDAYRLGGKCGGFAATFGWYTVVVVEYCRLLPTDTHTWLDVVITTNGLTTVPKCYD